MKKSDFRFSLPPELIAQQPPAQRGASRLLDLSAPHGIQDRHFSDLPSLLRPGDLLVFNNTKVMKARLFGHKASGGKIEILIDRLCAPQRALAQIRASKAPKAGSQLLVGDCPLQVLGRQDDLFELECPQQTFAALMEQHGHMPLPPYIQRDDSDNDQERYQTVYATQPGAVAAPTAGLHFDDAMLRQLAASGIDSAWVTLHVGAGTFQTVRVEDLDQHQMHSEYLEVNEQTCEQIHHTRSRGGRVIAVGTTSVRSLESAAAAGELRPMRGDTRLFIRPGYPFRLVDAMITNFHLPESTLLMLVCAFAGYDRIMDAYRHAVAQRYRFFSYGDAMLLVRQPQD